MNAHIYPQQVVFCDLDTRELEALFKDQDILGVIDAVAIATMEEGRDQVYTCLVNLDEHLLRFIVTNGSVAVTIKKAFERTIALYKGQKRAQQNLRRRFQEGDTLL